MLTMLSVTKKLSDYPASLASDQMYDKRISWRAYAAQGAQLSCALFSLLYRDCKQSDTGLDTN